MDDGTEADVREEIIRPLLHRLGYRRGTENNIRTEFPLRYTKRFLGRKNGSHDPDLRGRADYICEVVSYGRWVVEAKATSSALTRDDAEQAHSYAAHPEVGAHYYLLTNGRAFQIYATSLPDNPVLEWRFEETDIKWVEISNILSPEAIRRRAMLIAPRPGKPLGPNLPPEAKIVGGYMGYSGHKSNVPNVPFIEGIRSTIRGDFIRRNESGLIEVRLTLAGGFAQMDALNQRAGLNRYELRCADEFVSTSADFPNIFQGSFRSHMPPGLSLEPPLAQKKTTMTFGMDMSAYVQATGFLEEDRFVGTFLIQQHVCLDVDGVLREQFANAGILETETESHGEFEIRIAN